MTKKAKKKVSKKRGKVAKKKATKKRKLKRNPVKKKKVAKKKKATKKRKKVAKKKATKKRTIKRNPVKKKIQRKKTKAKKKKTATTNGFAVAVVHKTAKGPNKILFAENDRGLDSSTSKAATYKSKASADKLARDVVKRLKRLPAKRTKNMGVQVIPAFSNKQITDLKNL